MSAAARSILVYSIYLFGLGAALLVVPNIPIRLFGMAEATDVWVRILGMTVVFFSIYYFIAARNEFRPFFVASAATRISVPFAFGAFIAAGFAPWNLILFTPLDVLFAVWTWLALRSSPQMAASSAA
ncbi:MAG: hypothetical protein Q7S35_04535 [Candidatus Limnocylindrales bacterium]|nr:hypothetical protein [Candidatus Limnocylindrales bacterium]